MATERVDGRPGGGLAGTTIVLRTRQHWQALDLGFALAREHAGMLYGSWLILTLPIAMSLAFGLPRQSLVALFVFWWLKPLYERLTLLYLSKVVFAERLSPWGLAVAFLRACNVQILATLVWRRFSLTRSLDQPIALLEGASGARRRTRLQVLHRQLGFRAGVLIAVMALLETALTFAARAGIFLLVPGALDESSLRQAFLEGQFGLWPYFLAVWFVGPLYAACGFSLYINRRCELEGWDLEVGFRRLAARLRGSVVLLCCLVGGVTLAGDVRAAAASAAAPDGISQAMELTRGTAVPDGAQSQRLAQQDNGDAAAIESRRLIDSVLAGAKFHRVDVQRWPSFLEDLRSDSSSRSTSTPLPRWLHQLLAQIVDIVWWLAWAVVIAGGAWLGYRYRYWLAELAAGRRLRRNTGAARVVVIAGVRLGDDDIANDSEAQVGALWSRGEQRAALAMLLRLTLVSLVRDHGCVFAHGDTELDCTRRVAATQDSARSTYFLRLIDAWQDVAYAHRWLALHTAGELVTAYRQVMAPAPSIPMPIPVVAAGTR